MVENSKSPVKIAILSLNTVFNSNENAIIEKIPEIKEIKRKTRKECPKILRSIEFTIPYNGGIFTKSEILKKNLNILLSKK